MHGQRKDSLREARLKHNTPMGKESFKRPAYRRWSTLHEDRRAGGYESLFLTD